MGFEHPGARYNVFSGDKEAIYSRLVAMASRGSAWRVRILAQKLLAAERGAGFDKSSCERKRLKIDRELFHGNQ